MTCHDSRSRPTFLFVLAPLRKLGFATIALLSLASGDLSVAAEPTVIPEKWQILLQGRRIKGIKPLPENGPLVSITELSLEGAEQKDPYHLGKFNINGEFGIDGGLLTRTSGRSAAVRLIEEAENFELETNLTSEGLGGWFWLIGWKDGHGYALYNVTLKVSGSPWQLSEFRGGKGIPEESREVNRMDWKGGETFRVAVANQRLRVMAGNAVIVRDMELPNYHAGSVILGTYDTPYGPRDLKIRSARYRELKVKDND